MTNNSNPFDLDGKQVRNKGYNNDIIRATVLDVLPNIHSVRVNPRDNNSPVVAPVLTPKYGMHVLPEQGERVTIVYITDNVPVVVGGVYLADGPNPPEADAGDVVFGNGTGSEITVHDDGHISIITDGSERVDIDQHRMAVELTTAQSITASGPPEIVEYDSIRDDQDEMFDTSTHQVTLEHGGVYEIDASVEIPSPGQNNLYQMYVFVNDNAVKRRSKQSNNNEPMSIPVTTNLRLDAGDTIDVRLDHDAGTRSLNGSGLTDEFSVKRKGI